jgi:hypothetical protein
MARAKRTDPMASGPPNSWLHGFRICPEEIGAKRTPSFNPRQVIRRLRRGAQTSHPRPVNHRVHGAHRDRRENPGSRSSPRLCVSQVPPDNQFGSQEAMRGRRAKRTDPMASAPPNSWRHGFRILPDGPVWNGRRAQSQAGNPQIAQMSADRAAASRWGHLRLSVPSADE